jgi:hypothetical protein
MRILPVEEQTVAMAKHLDVGRLLKHDDKVWPVSLTDDERPAEPLTGLTVDSFDSLAALCQSYDAPARIPGDVIKQMAEAGLGPRIV